MSMRAKNQLYSDQRGIVSIIVSMFLIMVISLMVVAMSQNSTREQRQAEDRALIAQAFTNAETGINDTSSYLYTHPDADAVKFDCNPLPSGAPSQNVDVDASGNVQVNGPNKYACVNYSTAPLEIMYDAVSTSTPRVVPIVPIDDAGNPVKLKDMTISWDDTSNRDANPNCGFTAPASELPANCTYGGLRVELVAPQINRQATQEGELISYLLPSPSNTVGTINLNALTYPDNQGLISLASCNGPTDKRRCSKTLENVNKTSLFFLSLRSLYQPVNLTIEGVDEAGHAVRFKNTQIVIDVVGKAADQVQRVQVRIPANSQFAYPGFGLQSVDTLCKLLTVSQTTAGGVTTSGVGTANSAECPGFPAGGGGPGVSGFIPPTSTNPDDLSAGITTRCQANPDQDGCNSDPGTYSHYFWTLGFINNSPQGNYTGCKWTFSDGAVVSNKNCSPGDMIYHEFAVAPGYAGPFNVALCNKVPVTVTLEQYGSNGRTATANYNHKIPNCGA